MSIKECFEEAEDEETAAECVHCLRKHGEWVYFDAKKKRLVLGREKFDSSSAEDMKRISKLLKISNEQSYKDADEKFNLTMY